MLATQCDFFTGVLVQIETYLRGAASTARLGKPVGRLGAAVDEPTRSVCFMVLTFSEVYVSSSSPRPSLDAVPYRCHGPICVSTRPCRWVCYSCSVARAHSCRWVCSSVFFLYLLNVVFLFSHLRFSTFHVLRSDFVMTSCLRSSRARHQRHVPRAPRAPRALSRRVCASERFRVAKSQRTTRVQGS